MNDKLEYFLKNYQLYYTVEDNSIQYGEGGKGNILISKHVDDAFYESKRDINPADVVWKEWKGVRIPFLFDQNDQQEMITEKDGCVTINYDIVASAFYFLSGWNEYVNSQKDQYGRVSFKSSMLNQLNIINIPVVNYYFDILHSAQIRLHPQEKKKIWGGKTFGVALTHDIDTCRSAWIEGSFSELKKKNFLSIPKLIFRRFTGKDDWFNFRIISKIDKRYADSSTFYFLPQKGKSGSWANADYDVTSKSIQKEISELKDGGHEISVHGSFGTHLDTEKLKKEIERIGKSPVVGNRFHFLMFDAEKTVSVLEVCNIKYDATLGFAEQPGFRRGTCYPFFLYNFEKNRISEVIEIPLIVMDTTLGHPKYLGLTQDESFEKVKPLIDEVVKFNGVLTILWHNTYFSDYKYTGWKDVYVKILDYCKKNNGVLTSGKAIYEKVNG